MTEDLRICPKCGGKNLLQASRCVHCGLELEDFFRIDDHIDDSVPILNQPDDEGLPEFLRDLQKPDLGGVFGVSDSDRGENKFNDNPQPEKPPLPDWLTRVRERAKTEDPASQSRTPSRTPNKKIDDTQRVSQEFDDWIARLKESSRRESMLKAKATQPEATEEGEVPDWLQRVRDLQPKLGDSADDGEKPETPEAEEKPKAWDSGWSEEDLERLRRDEYPVPVKDATFDPKVILENEDTKVNPTNEPVADPGALTDPTSADNERLVVAPPIEHQIGELDDEGEPSHLETEASSTQEQGEPALTLTPMERPESDEPSEKNETEEVQPDLLLMKSQQERATLLGLLVFQEGKPTYTRKLGQGHGFNWSQTVLPLLLLVGVIGALLFGDSLWPRQAVSQPAGVAFFDSLNRLQQQDSILVVLDYQAATSAEVEIGAGEALKTILSKSTSLTLQTTQPSGLWLVDALRLQPGLESLPEIKYVPGGILGMLMETMDISGVAMGEGQIKKISGFSRVLVISDSSSTIRDWIEQINPWLPAGSLLFLAPHQEAIQLSVYYDNGQIGGYLAGLADFAIFEPNASSLISSSTSYRAYQVGLMIMISLLLLGMVIKVDHDTDRQDERGRIE